MAIKMVREPSKTPNINNIDDIIPMRYAYGGQNGFVIGKGTEISNTVSGLNFTVNSGRLVLQGVECDIDATGVTITIDNIATKRYYTVYLEVNLGLNTATIKSEYDTATYPTIDAGDDLTENTTGIARLPLYQFTATSGIISEVNKVVESIKYTQNIKVKNADYATNAGNATNADYATNAGNATNADYATNVYKTAMKITTTLLFGNSSGSTNGTKDVEFDFEGLRIGNFAYGNLMFNASSSFSGSFSNTNIVKLTINDDKIHGIYSAGNMSIKGSVNGNVMTLVDRYGSGYSSYTPKISDYIGASNITINFGDFCVITIIGILLELN